MVLTALMVLTHELGHSWGHGGTKSPLGMLAGRCLVPCGLAAGAQGHSGLGVPCLHACCLVACRCLVPSGLVSLGLGGALLLAALFIYGCPSVVGCSCGQAFVVSDAVSRASARCSADESEVVARTRGYLQPFFLRLLCPLGVG